MQKTIAERLDDIASSLSYVADHEPKIPDYNRRQLRELLEGIENIVAELKYGK